MKGFRPGKEDDFLRRHGVEPNSDIKDEIQHLTKGFELRVNETKETLDPMWKKYGIDAEGAMLQLDMDGFKQAIEECDGAKSMFLNGNIQRTFERIVRKLEIAEKKGTLLDEHGMTFLAYLDGCRDFTVDAMRKFNQECICQHR